MNKSKSLIILEETLKEIPLNVTSFLYTKKGIRLCKDVIDYLNKTPFAYIEIIGYDYLNKPIYSKEIKINRRYPNPYLYLFNGGKEIKINEVLK